MADQIASSLADEESFRDALIAAIPALRAFAYSMTRNDTEADDLAQQALANAWAARAQFRPGTYFKAWLFRIARNIFLGGKRRSWRQVRLDQTEAEETLVARDNPSAAVELNDIRLALAQLPEEQRECLVLIWAGGFSYDEVAEIAGVAIGTIKSRLSRGKLALIRILDEGRTKRDDKPALAAMSELIDEADRRAAVASGAREAGPRTAEILPFLPSTKPRERSRPAQDQAPALRAHPA